VDVPAVVRHHHEMGIGDAYLTGLDAPNDAWDRVHAAELLESMSDALAVVREEELLRYAARPVTRFVIKFALDQWPGATALDDASWVATVALARRELVVQREAGIEDAMGDLSFGVLEWIDACVGSWDDQQFEALVRAQVDELLDAGRRGRERGRQLRERRGQDPAPGCSSCWLLRHPGDHYFRLARATARDERLCELLDAQITLLADSYDRLAADHDVHRHGELVLELGVPGPLAPGWSEPVTTTVLSVEAGEVSVGDRLGLRLVADPDASFNGTLMSVRPGERWRTCAHRLHDGTIVPDDGTRRLAA